MTFNNNLVLVNKLYELSGAVKFLLNFYVLYLLIYANMLKRSEADDKPCYAEIELTLFLWSMREFGAEC